MLMFNPSLAIFSFSEAAARLRVIRDARYVKDVPFALNFVCSVQMLIILKIPPSSSLHSSVGVHLCWAAGERKLLALDLVF